MYMQVFFLISIVNFYLHSYLHYEIETANWALHSYVKNIKLSKELKISIKKA